MGGYGSGRPARLGLLFAELTLSLDVNRIQRAGYLKLGTFGTWQWTRSDEEVGRIGLSGETNALALSYRIPGPEGRFAEVHERLRVVYTPCRLGGRRPFFECPGTTSSPCGRRVLKLFFSRGRFRCRHCGGIRYASQGEGLFDRVLRRRAKIRARVGGDHDGTWLLSPQPSGMWRKTYRRLYDAAVAIEIRLDDILAMRIGQLERRSSGTRQRNAPLRNPRRHVSPTPRPSRPPV